MTTKKGFGKDFILVVVGQIISLFGNSILRFALPLYLFRETESAKLFGLVSACSFLPMIFLSFFGGILADRVNKRNIMVILDFATALLAAILFLLLGHVPLVPLLIGGLMLLYGISGTYQPTVQASIPALLAQEKMMQGTAMISQISALSSILGPVIGGMLFASFGIYTILGVSVLCFFLSAVMELFIRIPFVKRQDHMGLVEIIKSDFYSSSSFIRKENPVLMRVILLIAAFNFLLTSMLIVGTPILILDSLAFDEKMVGFAEGALAVGGLCGGILTAVLGQKLKLSKCYLLLFFGSVCIGGMAIPFLLGAMPMLCYAVITVSSFLLMGMGTLFSIQMITVVQMQTPPELVGKVIALMMAISMCAQPAGQAIYGLVFDWFGQTPGWILLTAGILSAGLALGAKRTFCLLEHI